jgi:hypothetical protein
MRVIYWVLGGVLVVLVIAGLISYTGQKETEEAQAKAEQLVQSLEANGLFVPEDTDRIVRVLGDDGGAVCEDPGAALRKAVLFDQIVNGASHVGRRPVIGDSRVVQGEILIIQTYCPDELEDFAEDIEDLEFDDVIKR